MSLYQAKYRIEPARLRDWDYRSRGWYFVTICTQHRASIFRQVVRGQIELSRLGHIAYSELTNLPSHYLNVQIDAHIVMPLQHLDATIGLKHVKVIHCNDAKAARGSRLDRHQQIGKGTIGIEPFRILLNDLRLAHAAFIAETPIDQPGDDRRNVEALKKLVT